ncbi:MAG: lysine--tRNA ligase, partial [Alphaproteobacteria bacterium]|nr:lysine--tRNA ligase [Alphaproteobacteria bacterium]
IPYRGDELDFSKYERINYTEKMNEFFGCNILDFDDVEELRNRLLEQKMFHKSDLEDLVSVPALVDFVYKRKIRVNIIQPTLLYNYPAYMVPLARRNDTDERLIDMFQFLASGVELCKGYSELVNPIQQMEAFNEQAENIKAGDEEAFKPDTEYVRAMEHGMPPQSGVGFGLDRLATVLFDLPTVRDTVLFPMVK